MSDTEREAFEAWQIDMEQRSGSPIPGNEAALLWEGWAARARRSTTTEARAPLSDEQIEAGKIAYWNAYEGNEGATGIVRAVLLAARAPAPPLEAQQDWFAEFEEYYKAYLPMLLANQTSFTAAEVFTLLRATAQHAYLCAKLPVAAPPADPPSSSLGDPTETPSSAVQRPAGGDDASFTLEDALGALAEEEAEIRAAMRRRAGGDEQ